MRRRDGGRARYTKPRSGPGQSLVSWDSYSLAVFPGLFLVQ